MKAYQQRVVEEKQALDEKILALQTFLKGSLAVQVPLEDLFDLYTQKRAMKKYAKVLGKRIAKFSDD